MDSLEENKTWKFIEMKKVNSQMKRKLLIPNGDLKSGNEGNIVRHKAQLAAKGCSQKTMMKCFLLWLLQQVGILLIIAATNKLE